MNTKTKDSTATKVLTAFIGKDLLHKEIRQVAWELKTSKSRYFQDNRKIVPNGWGSSYVTDFKYMGLIKQVGKKYRITSKGLLNLSKPWTSKPLMTHKDYTSEIKRLKEVGQKLWEEKGRLTYQLMKANQKIKELQNSQINKVSKKDCHDAIEYLFVNGFVDEMTTDKKHYTTILLKKVANDLNIKLEGVE